LSFMLTIANNTFTVCRYAECHYAECHYAEFHYTECHYAEYRGALLTHKEPVL
jgi:hypothetical protein